MEMEMMEMAISTNCLHIGIAVANVAKCFSINGDGNEVMGGWHYRHYTISHHLTNDVLLEPY